MTLSIIDPSSVRLDRARRRLVPKLLGSETHAVERVQRALADGRHGVVDEEARRLLKQLRHGSGTSSRVDALMRSEREEFMDSARTPEWHKRSHMRTLHRFNRQVGSNAVFRGAIDSALGPLEEAHVVDLAAGTGGFFLWLAGHALPGRRLRLTSTDLVGDYVDMGRSWAAESGIEVGFEVLDATALDQRAVDAAPADLFCCFQAAHHLPPGAVVRMIASAIHAAPRGLLIVDGYRSPGVAAGVFSVSMATAPKPTFVHDAVLSIRRSTTPAELMLLARLAGASKVSAHGLSPAFCMLHAQA